MSALSACHQLRRNIAGQESVKFFFSSPKSRPELQDANAAAPACGDVASEVAESTRPKMMGAVL